VTGVRSTRPPRVVVGIDGSEQSKQALRWAAHFAKATGAQLEAVAAWQYPFGYGWSAVPVEWSPEQDTEKILTATIDEVMGADRPADMVLEVLDGNPAKVLITRGKGAQMIVVGSRGHGGFAGLLLGSVSSSVAEHATCPVLVVHGEVIPELENS
jgi:nucleotide-binding universal stress UspA family protein